MFQESIDTENAEVIDAYKKARSKKGNGSDAIDAKIVEDVSDSSPEEVLAS